MKERNEGMSFSHIKDTSASFSPGSKVPGAGAFVSCALMCPQHQEVSAECWVELVLRGQWLCGQEALGTA